MKTKTAYISRRMLALLLTLAMVLAIVPPIDVFAATQDDSSKQIVFDATSSGAYYHRPIVINAKTMAGFETRNGRYNILIKGEPFSVTVQGLTNVDITFNNVTINRVKTGQSDNIESGSGGAFLKASQDLGWSSGNNHFVPTCPFWILDGAEVVASFIGNNVFKAGSNLWRIANKDATSLTRTNQNYYHGYAGIQIEGGSSLTIQSGNVEAWGAHQMTNVSTIENAKSIYITEFSNGSSTQPPEVSTQSWAGNDAAGGAGIGGGTYYNYNTDLDTAGGKTYTHATPGNLTINGGNITAVGGFKAAGIGGGVNGALSSDGGIITINGDPATSVANKTKVTAIGSFYAAGIGEGDSTPSKAASDSFRGSYSLVINGGEVYAQGGYKAAGIGTTDELSDNSNNSLGITSGLTITLNGGDITALSGEASDPNNATAAIGAGDGTNMADYSISIAEGTVVKAVSYSKYAISNIGTSASTAPQNVIDPNTYMYLAYYARSGNDSVVSTKQRTFHLYQIKRTERGDFMLVVDHTEDVLGQTTHDFVYLGYDESLNKLYVVDQNGKTVTDPTRQVEIFYILYDGNSNDGTPYSAVGDGVVGGEEVEINLSTVSGYEALAGKIDLLTTKDDVSYYFAEPEMKSFTVPAGYTAVAMTLYRPEDFGGRYIFHVPMDNGSNIYAVIEKMGSGDSSGQIIPEFDSHFTMGTPLTPGDPAIRPDKISAQLTDLVVASGAGKHLGLNDAEKVFAPGTKSYTVWLPVGTTQFTVTPSWSTASNTSYTVTIREGKGANQNITNGSAKTYNISANDIKEIWIEKQDRSGNTSASKIVYKLTVRVKSSYTMDLNDLDKIYDGSSVIPGVSAMGTKEYSEFTVVPDKPATTGGNPSLNANNTNKIENKNFQLADPNRVISITLSFKVDAAKGTVTVTTAFSRQTTGSSTITGNVDTVFTVDSSGNWTQQTPDTKYDVGSSRNHTAAMRDNQFVLINDDPSKDWVVLWTWSASNNITAASGTSYEDAKAAATAEVIQKLQDTNQTGEPVTVEKSYSASSQGSSVLTLQATSFAPGSANKTFTYTNNASQSGTVTVSASLKAITDKTSLLAKEKVEYTYTQTKNAYGVAEVKELGTTAPSAAGTYVVTASVNATEFQASGERTFTISQRPITIIGIGNWRYYLSADDAEDETIYITPGTGDDKTKFYSGEIRLDNVVEYADGDKDKVTLVINESTGMYFADKVVGDLQDNKIVIEATIATDSVSANYTFAGYPAGGDYAPGELRGSVYFFYVPGQITYEVDGAMFGYGQLGGRPAVGDNPAIDPEAVPTWHKYYPVIDFSNLTNDTLYSYLRWKANGESDDSRIEYHSPNNQSHAEYIYVRSVNEGTAEARYAVDITFGSMTFQYTKTIWNVNTLEYERVDGQKEGELASVWVDPSVAFFAHGEALTNGDILVENRSNRPIEFTATVEINTHCVMIGYTSDMEFKDADLNQQHRVAARMIWGDTIKWSEKQITFNSTNSRNTGNVGYATTPTIEIDAAGDVGINAAGGTISNAPGYKIISIRLFGIPTSTETVGSVTISLVPTGS